MKVAVFLVFAAASTLACADDPAARALLLRQQFQQRDLEYRQQIQQAQPSAPNTDALRRAELLRFEQERQNQLSRFRWEGEPPARPMETPPSVREPAVVTAPVPRRVVPQGSNGGWVEWAPPDQAGSRAR